MECVWKVPQGFRKVSGRHQVRTGQVEQVKSGHIKLGQVKSGQVKSGQVNLGQVEP